MADAALTEQAPAPGDDVVRRPAGLLVHDHETRRARLGSHVPISAGIGLGHRGDLPLQPAQDLLDLGAFGDRRVGDELQLRRALHADLAPDRSLELRAVLAQRFCDGFVHRAQVDLCGREVRRDLHPGDGQQPQRSVGVRSVNLSSSSASTSRNSSLIRAVRG